VFNYRNY